MLKKQYVKSRHSYKVTFEIPQEELPEDVEVVSTSEASGTNEEAGAGEIN